MENEKDYELPDEELEGIVDDDDSNGWKPIPNAWVEEDEINFSWYRDEFKVFEEG